MPSIRARSRRRPRCALVLGGGGNLGAIQVGQLKALAERGIEPDLIVGCSVGALNGAAFAADPTTSGAAALESYWRQSLSEAESVMPGSWIPNPVLLVRKGASLHTNDGLRETVLRFLDGRTTFEELEIPFQCVATDVDAATETWFAQGDLINPILASAALPAVYPMMTFGGQRFLDGGVLNNVPVSRAVELGARKIFVLHVGLHGRPNPTVKRPVDSALIAYWISRNGQLARDLAAVPPAVEVVVLPPGERPELRFDDYSRTEQLIAQGYDNAATYLDELAAAETDETGRERAERLGTDVRRVIDELRGKVGARWTGHGPRPRRLTEREAGQHVDTDDTDSEIGDLLARALEFDFGDDDADASVDEDRSGS